MDLVAGVRKEGSRGGRSEFKWSDVKDSSHRENYLGHSLMAPVGRWQQGKDLSWYAKADGDDEEAKALKRREELQRVKDAEEEAMARALGLPLPTKAEANANLIPLGGATTKADEDVSSAKDPERRGHSSRRHGRDRSRSPRRARHDRSDDRDRDREHRHRRHHDDRGQDRHHRSRRHHSQDRDHRRRRSTSRDRRYEERKGGEHSYRRPDHTYSSADRRRDPERRKDLRIFRPPALIYDH